MGAFGKQLLNIVGRNVLGVDFEAQKRQRAMQDAVMAANREAGGLMSPVPGAMRQMQIGNVEGADITDAFGPAMEQGPSRQRSPQEIAAALADLQGRVPGFNSKPFADLLTAGKRDIRRDETGNYVDFSDPSIVGRAAPRAPDGGYVVQGAAGPQVRVAGGYNEALMQSEAAKATGQESAKSAYDLIDVPDGRGGSIKIPRSAYLGMLGQGQAGANSGMGYTPPAAQLAADQARAVGAATGEVERQQARLERAAAAPRQLTALDEMERLLPDVISGFGSEVRINTARAMALAGNEEAARKVAATETFINQGRILVAGIIKTFGSNPTEGERKFAEKMSGADAELNPETLKEGIRLQRERIFRELEDAGSSSAPRATTGPRTSMGRSRIISVGQ